MTISDIQLGTRFHSLLEVAGEEDGVDVASVASGDTDATPYFRRALGFMGDDGIFGGGTLYIPSGMTARLSGNMGPVLSVPRQVLLKFGPMASLLLEPGLVLVIEGMIEARPDRIFQLVTGSTPERGRVLFVSDRIPVVHPEWWGVEPIPGADPVSEARRVTVAMQDCLDAVHRHRHLHGSHAALRVELRQMYALDETLRVGQEPDAAVTSAAPALFEPRRNHDGLLVAGVGPSGGTGFIATRTQRPGPRVSAMLRLESVQGSRVEDFTFEGGWDAEVAVQLRQPWTLSARDGLPAGTLNVFRHCGLRNLRRAQVEVGPAAWSKE